MYQKMKSSYLRYAAILLRAFVCVLLHEASKHLFCGSISSHYFTYDIILPVPDFKPLFLANFV